jgi:hypothetical protein
MGYVHYFGCNLFNQFQINIVDLYNLNYAQIILGGGQKVDKKLHLGHANKIVEECRLLGCYAVWIL